MIKKMVFSGCLSMSMVVLSATAASQFNTQKQQLNYALGYSTGLALKEHNVPLDFSAYSQAVQAGFSGAKPAVTTAKMRAAMADFQQQQTKLMQKKQQSDGAKNTKAGAQYMADNKSKPGVVTLPSGLQYQVMTPGQGMPPKITDQVTVQYEGKLLNGKVFDSSYKRGKPVTFPVSGVIKGWQQALVLMKPGATWLVTIPPNLAYGERGTPGGPIGPNATLIFKIHLLSVKGRH